MKKSPRALAALTTAILALASCQKSETVKPKTEATFDAGAVSRTCRATSGYPGYPVNDSFCNASVTKALYYYSCNTKVTVGSVTINKSYSTGNLYVTYVTTGNWYLSTMQLYAGNGDSCNIPVDCYGVPRPGLFPYYGNVSASPVHVYTFQIPAATTDCFCVSAQARVVKINSCGVYQSQSVWADGIPVSSGGCTPSPATKFDVCFTDCTGGGGGHELRPFLP